MEEKKLPLPLSLLSTPVYMAPPPMGWPYASNWGPFHSFALGGGGGGGGGRGSNVHSS